MQKYKQANISDLIGKTMVEVKAVDEVELWFFTDDGRKFVLHHEQDCCEGVSIDDITGDLNDLVGAPILHADEVTSHDENPAGLSKKYQDSFTWTFYKFATIKGYVDVRWYGESNGCYSERVDFCEVVD